MPDGGWFGVFAGYCRLCRPLAGGTFFQPIRWASKVACPTLVLICDQDTVAPASAAAKAAARIPNAEVKHYPVGHFDVYRGEALVQSIEDQLEFLARFFR